MKKIIIFSALFLFLKINCQDYISLDKLREMYEYKKYTLNTKELYGFDSTIEVYNFFITPKTILLVSILPNIEIKENWKKIDNDKIKDKLLKDEKQIRTWVHNFPLKNKEFNFRKIVENINNENFVSYASLIEKFNIGNYPFPLISDYGVINITEKKVTIKKMYSFYNKFYTNFDKKEIFPLDIRNTEKFEINNYNHIYRYYLSKEIKINGNKGYQFWLFDHWRVIDGYNYDRGIDRFIYIPHMGIIGGSYDFYFEFRPRTSSNNYSIISNEKLWDNIINEKIMIAEELK
ncbi:hypothetical protein [Cloacibacterium normanense]|uniref:hypothetical protein n=1 Tax=Cloacibacterium normanense TaxID=237258 RepID=UPI003919E5A7